ncbi:uncharacterized protein F5147DRAFT_823318 [Suillus discolor]|uniref:Uncharacterized protein n=1 Tax=Suillus discolor TaxID=1912936 RepID=A0A9P7JN61_9AGAM|nr:uncharacterized protein F5147DRAFT_823318 [Suillus discolor]KAG2091224.1 hypothetical protein F5147DRAFT_823318 [Suillus discolor]
MPSLKARLHPRYGREGHISLRHNILEHDMASRQLFSVLDPHWGTIDDWVNFVDTVPARSMYIMLDFTVGILSDLIGFEGLLKVINIRNTSGQLPVLWQDNGTIHLVKGYDDCHESNLDQYGDMEAFGVHPNWQRELSKFASVQDRLREWKPFVMDKLTTFPSMTIIALDIDDIRVEKSTQLTVDGMTAWHLQLMLVPLSLETWPETWPSRTISTPTLSLLGIKCS